MQSVRYEDEAMGQAKKRGSHDQRVEQAKARIEALRPEFITCNDCKFQIMTIATANTRRIAGVDACFYGVCENCGSTTYAMKGTAEGVQDLVDALHMATGDLPLLGVQFTSTAVDG
jgi:Zn finger protein HypA/HybF involved in hydrogenase expression